jgi:hypothetical protein
MIGQLNGVIGKLRGSPVRILAVSPNCPARPHLPPNCDPAITPDISRCFRLVANGLRATTPGATATAGCIASHLTPGAPVASHRAHPTRAASGATGPPGARGGPPGHFGGWGEDHGARPGLRQVSGRVVQGIAASMKGTAFPRRNRCPALPIPDGAFELPPWLQKKWRGAFFNVRIVGYLKVESTPGEVNRS